MFLHQGFFLLIIAGFANAFNHYFNLLYRIVPGQFYRWCYHVIQAKSVAAAGTHQVHMMIVMVALSAFVFTQCILNTVVGCWNGVDDAFIYKGLKRAVNRYPVKMTMGVFFNIRVCQCAIAVQEQGQDLPAALRYT